MEKVVFKLGKFKDFKNEEREVIFCAVSQDLTKDYVYISGAYSDIPKVLRIGLSIRRSDDIFDEELGKLIALGKTKKDKTCVGKLYSTDKGLINATMVEALLEQELKYFQQNPGKYIKGYDQQKEKYLINN